MGILGPSSSQGCGDELVWVEQTPSPGAAMQRPQLIHQTICVSFLKIYLFILFIHERQRERERERQAEREAAPCREPDMGLDPRTPGSGPGLKAGAKPLSHPGIPQFFFLELQIEHPTLTNFTLSI